MSDINIITDRFGVLITETTIPILARTYGLEEDNFDICNATPMQWYFVDDNGTPRIMAPSAFDAEFTAPFGIDPADKLTFIARKK